MTSSFRGFLLVGLLLAIQSGTAWSAEDTNRTRRRGGGPIIEMWKDRTANSGDAVDERVGRQLGIVTVPVVPQECNECLEASENGDYFGKVKKCWKNCPLALMKVAPSCSVSCCKEICLASKIPEATTSRTPSSVYGRDDGAFDNDGQFPDEESLVVDDGKDPEWPVVDDRKVPVRDNNDDGGGVPHGDPDAAGTFPTPMKNPDAWSRGDVCAASPPDELYGPDLDDIMAADEDGEGPTGLRQLAPGPQPPPMKAPIEKEEELPPREGGGTGRELQAFVFWTLAVVSKSAIRLNWAIPQDMVDDDFLFVCWKEAGDFSIDLCNVNNRDVTLGEPGVVDLGLNADDLRIFSYTVEDLDCETKYKFKIRAADGATLHPAWGRKGTTMSCAQCDWGDTVTAFSGQYVIQTSLLENPADTCRIHRGDFDGDGKTDVLRTCDDRTRNALWNGSAGGFAPRGYVITASTLQNSANTCRLHVADFTGDGRDDLLRTCDNPTLNGLWEGNPSMSSQPFTWKGYQITGSVLENSAGTCRLHVGNFNGGDGADLLRSCDDRNFNALWHSVPGGGFMAKGYVLTGSMLQNSADQCRLHVGDFDADGKSDLLRSCDNPTFNYLFLGSSTSFDGFGYILTGSVLQNSANTCQLHLGNFNGSGGTDMLRSCDNPAFNYLFYANGSGFDGQGYQLTGTVLENTANTCRLHVGDFNDDGKEDLFRSCDSPCYNYLFHSSDGGFDGQGYTLTTTLLEHSLGICKLHMGDYNGVDGTDMLRTCFHPMFHALFRPL